MSTETQEQLRAMNTETLKVPDFYSSYLHNLSAEKQIIKKEFEDSFTKNIVAICPEFYEFFKPEWSSSFYQLKKVEDKWGKAFKSFKKGSTIKFDAKLSEALNAYISERKEKLSQIESHENREKLIRERLQQYTPLVQEVSDKFICGLYGMGLNIFIAHTEKYYSWAQPIYEIQINKEGVVSETVCKVTKTTDTIKSTKKYLKEFETIDALLQQAADKIQPHVKEIYA